MSKFTPGPWVFSTEPQPNGCPIIGNKKGLMVAMLSHSVNVPQYKDTALANAHLIAAAPEMYEAIDNFIKQVEAHGGDYLLGNFSQLSNSIKKARGES